MNQGLEVILDWLEFTVWEINLEEVILDILRLKVEDFTRIEKGSLGYSNQIKSGHITILSEGNEDMGIHIILSGQGCREYEAEANLVERIQYIENESTNLIDLIKRVNQVKGKCTRIDIAVDDKKGDVIKFEEILKDIEAGNVISKWKNSTEMTKRTLETGEVIGKTLYIGSTASNFRLRIYDKALEQKQNENPLTIDRKWVRLELEIKKDKALKLQEILINGKAIGTIVSQLLNNYIRFVVPSKDKNKSRWTTRKYWTNIINETGKLKLSEKPEPKTIEELEQWIEKQVAPSLATVLIANGGDMDQIMGIVANGQQRLKPKHINMIKNS